MRKNIKIILFLIIIIILSIVIIKIYDTNINPIIENEKIIKQNKMLTMMFESPTEAGVYEADDEETSFNQSE